MKDWHMHEKVCGIFAAESPRNSLVPQWDIDIVHITRRKRRFHARRAIEVQVKMDTFANLAHRGGDIAAIRRAISASLRDL